jgi:hypothetical protein
MTPAHHWAQMRAFEQAMRARAKDVTVVWFNAGHGLSGAAEDEHALGLFFDSRTNAT